MEAIMLTELNLHEVSLVKHGANQGAKLALVKHYKEDENMEELENKIQELTKALEEATAKIAKAEEELEANQATIAELSKKEEDVEEIEKAELPESVVKQLEEADKVAKEFAEFKNAQVVKELETRVEAHSAVFKSDEEKAQAVETLKSMTDAERTFMFDTIAKSAKIIEEAADKISKEIGENGSNDVKVSDTVTKDAKELAEKKGITLEKAKVEIVKNLSAEDRDLYNKGE